MHHAVCGSVLVSALTAFPRAQEPQATPDPVRATVRGAIDWIERQAVPVPDVDGAVLFPATEGSRALPATCIYGGSAGVAIFLENAAVVLDDAAARRLADAAYKGLRARGSKDRNGHATWSKGSAMGSTGLYTGDAGVGDAFLVRAQLRHDAEALAAAVEVGDALLARGERDGEELHWDAQVDVIFGAAGTSLFLLDLGTETVQPRFLDAARAAGRWLVAEADLVPSTRDPQLRLPIWKFAYGAGGKMHMPNFSHGTAGVAYALARIGAVTKDDVCAKAARGGAEWLLEHAVQDGDGLKWCANDKGPPTYMGGWCHGPAGTGRLFLLLHAETGEQRWLDAATAGARWVMAYQAKGETQGPGGKAPYFPPSFCCGVAGVADFFCDLYRVTGNEQFAVFARKAGNYLVDVAVADADGRKWRNGPQAPGGPTASKSTDCNVDLMIGASGEAMALLRLLTLSAKPDPIRHLPDRRVAK